MAELNLERLRTLIGEINDALSKLKELASEPEITFLSDFRLHGAAKYYLIVAIEAMIDICNHIVARKGGRAPQDYADCFRILGEINLFDGEFVQKLIKMTKFRNLLVHLYCKVDDREIYRVIKENLGDFDEYLKRLGALLK